MKILRPYQVKGKQMLYDSFASGMKRVIYWMATGAGKTTVFCDIIKELYGKGFPVVLVMRRRELIGQASKSLDSYGVDHGIYMAGHRRFYPKELVQVCSIDTLDARSIYPHADKANTILVVDESHDSTPKAKKYVALFSHYPNAHIMGFTATPFADNSMFEDIICPITPAELRDQGFLVPDRCFVPSTINVDGIKKSHGDFNERQLFDASSQPQIVGDFVRDWKKYGQGRPTLLYSVNCKHSEIIASAFLVEGVPVVCVDASTKQPDRIKAIRRLVSGEIKIIINVNLFSVGVDIPEVSCIQLCRPTLSLIWHVQAIGRGLRISPSTGKRDCIIIDNAANILRHGSVYDPRDATLEKRKRAKECELKIRRCAQCFYVFEASISVCPNCGYMNPVIERTINHSEGELTEYKLSDEEQEVITRRSIIMDLYKLKFVGKTRFSHQTNWAYKKLIEKYGIKSVRNYAKEIQLPEEFL